MQGAFVPCIFCEFDKREKLIFYSQKKYIIQWTNENKCVIIKYGFICLKIRILLVKGEE